MRHRLAITLACAVAASASAQGLATSDLTEIAQGVASALGSGFEMKAESKRVILICTTCAGAPIVDLVIGRQADGTEERVRSGATSMAELQRLCRARSPHCTVSALGVAPAVGWVSAYRLGDREGSTAVIIRDGDMLTIRSLAPDPASARKAIDRLLPIVRARIVGP